jgi:ABC-2 type transport system permease protein
VIGLCLWIYPSLLAALAIVREKEQGTILQAYASSITSVELLAGKALAYLLIGLAIAVMLISLGCILFDLRFAGDPTPYLVSTVIFVLDSVVFGLMIGSGVTTQAAAVQGVAFAGFTTALLLSGFLYPLRNIQFPFNYVSYMVPARYYMMLSRDAFVRGSGWAGLWYVPLLLLLFFFLYFRVCNKRFSSMQIDA